MGDVLTESEFNTIVWTFTLAAVIFTGCRLYTRAFIVKSLGLDDALIFFGQLVALGLAAIITWHMHFSLNVYNAIVNNGFWNAASTTLYDNTNIVYLSGFTSDAVYILTLPFVKCSILAFYRRIDPLRSHHVVLYVVACFIVTQAIACFMFLTFALDPPIAWLDYLGSESEFRFNTDRIQIVNSSFQVLYDVILLLLPLPTILTIQIRGRDRAGLILLYLLSIGSLVATIIRLYEATQFTFYSDELDGQERRIPYMAWAAIEVMTAIICANIPALPAFFRTVRRTIMKTFLSSYADRERGSSRSGQWSRDYFNRPFHLFSHASGSKGSQGDEPNPSQVDVAEKKHFTASEEFRLDQNMRISEPGQEP